MPTVISSIADAFEYIDTYRELNEGPEVTFHGEILKFNAEIEGRNYSSSIPGDLARGIWEFQEEIYRAAAFAIYGNDNIKSLTEEQRASFQLIFKVSEGSTDLFASLEIFLKELGEGFKTMQSSHKGITLVAIALVLAMGYGAYTLLDTQMEAKKSEIEASVEVAKEEAQTKRIELIAGLARNNPEVNRFMKATEEGARAIIKGASDADKIVVGSIKFGRDEITAVNQRAARGNATAQIIVSDFNVSRADARDGGITRFWLTTSDKTEFSAVLTEDDFEEKDLAQIWSAIRTRTKIKLEVNATLIRNQIRNSHIIRVVHGDHQPAINKSATGSPQ